MNLSSIARFFRAHHIYWSVKRELAGYTDRELNDIGIARSDIARIAREAASA